jgi:hypothetical protein
MFDRQPKNLQGFLLATRVRLLVRFFFSNQLCKFEFYDSSNKNDDMYGQLGRLRYRTSNDERNIFYPPNAMPIQIHKLAYLSPMLFPVQTIYRVVHRTYCYHYLQFVNGAIHIAGTM